MRVTYYPLTSRDHKWISKTMDINGTCEIVNDELVFKAFILGVKNLKSSNFSLSLNEIENVELMTLNLIMPFGVCVTMKDGEDYVFGLYKRKMLIQMIKDAKSNLS